MPCLKRGIRPEFMPPVEEVRNAEFRLASEDKRLLKNPDGLSEPIEE